MIAAQRLSTRRNRRRSDEHAIDGDVVKAEIDGLSALAIGELRARWFDVVGRPAPLAFRRAFLARALAHEIQVKAYGGLSAATMRRLRELVIAAREDRFDEALGASSVKPGTLLIRVWQGTTHRVMAAKDGFIWNGDRYGSLSTIAKAITGVSWNGWTFFGLKRPARRNKNARRNNETAAPMQSPAESAADIGDRAGARAGKGEAAASAPPRGAPSSPTRPSRHPRPSDGLSGAASLHAAVSRRDGAAQTIIPAAPSVEPRVSVRGESDHA